MHTLPLKSWLTEHTGCSWAWARLPKYTTSEKSANRMATICESAIPHLRDARREGGVVPVVVVVVVDGCGVLCPSMCLFCALFAHPYPPPYISDRRIGCRRRFLEPVLPGEHPPRLFWLSTATSSSTILPRPSALYMSRPLTIHKSKFSPPLWIWHHRWDRHG